MKVRGSIREAKREMRIGLLIYGKITSADREAQEYLSNLGVRVMT